MLLYISGVKVLIIFNDADTRIKYVQIGDHEMKILEFSDGPTLNVS